MRRFNNQKKKLSMTIALVLIVFIGLAYAFLNEKLIINNILSYNSMNFEVGFIDITDGGGTIKSTGIVSNDGKTINVSCNIGDSKTQESCIVKATIINNSSFNIGLSKEPIITYDDKYIHTLTVKWKNHPTFLNTTVHQNGFIKQGESEEIVITVKTKFLDKNNLPEAGTQIPITIEFDFVEYPEATLPKTTDLAILPATNCSKNGDIIEYLFAFAIECPTEIQAISSVFNTAKRVIFEKGTEIPQEAIDIWYLTENRDIVLYRLTNEKNSEYYDLYIQSDKQIYANENMSWFFSACNNVEEIVGLELMDTSMTTNMEGMFFNFGISAESVNLDLSSLDTSNVTNMSYMFVNFAQDTELLYTSYNLDISNFDTSNVEDMSCMFLMSGYFTDIFVLDVSNFDTSSVTNMRGMFVYTGYGSESFVLNVSNFDTSKVTDMSYMFVATGYSNLNFTLDVSNFDTSNVEDMSYMFPSAGHESTVFTLDVSGFDTSKVTDMSRMFVYAGYSNPTFSLDVSNFDTSKVEGMEGMFNGAGYNSTVFTLDVSKFDTSNVTNMNFMFYETGYNSTKLNTSITIRNPNVSYDSMLGGVAIQPGTSFIVNYTSDTESIIDSIVNTKTTDANVFKGDLVN